MAHSHIQQNTKSNIKQVNYNRNWLRGLSYFFFVLFLLIFPTKLKQMFSISDQ